jgi:hypothetical protein
MQGKRIRIRIGLKLVKGIVSEFGGLNKMKDKLIAILSNSCDDDIKSELLEEMIRFYCEDYFIFSAERNELIMEALGLYGFGEDAITVNKKEIFERFKEYMVEKYQKQTK